MESSATYLLETESLEDEELNALQRMKSAFSGGDISCGIDRRIRLQLLRDSATSTLSLAANGNAPQNFWQIDGQLNMVAFRP
ncbi:MAG: hypothetical protein R3C56_25505 [Pirellulaceae bacterium]